MICISRAKYYCLTFFKYLFLREWINIFCEASSSNVQSHRFLKNLIRNLLIQNGNFSHFLHFFSLANLESKRLQASSIPFLSRSSEVVGKKVLLNLESFKFLFNFNHSIFSNFDNSLITKTANFFISFNQNEDSFDEMTWDTLYKISQKTFVDETESSKKTSAGAGLTDND